MPFNGSGGYTLPYNWQSDAANGINITASRMDGQFNDLAQNGFPLCLTRDGQGYAQANLPMGGFIHTGVGDGSATTHYLALGQFQTGTVIFGGTAGGTSDVITLTISPAITSLIDGMEIRFRASTINLTTTPTLQVNSTAAKVITKFGGFALAAGDMQENMACTVRYDQHYANWILVNPYVVSVGGLGTASTANTGTSGHNLGFLDGANTYSATQTFGSIVLSGTISGGTTASFSGDVTTNGTNVLGTNGSGARTVSTSAPSGTPADGDIWLTRVA